MIKLLHEGRQPDFIEALQSAVIRRHGRLLMPAFASCLVIIVFHHLTGIDPNWGFPAKNIFVELWWWVLECLRNLNYWTSFALRYNGVTWTIIVELKGSMAIFAWLFATHSLRPQWRLLLTLGLSLSLVMLGLGAMYASFFVGLLTCELDLLNTSGQIEGIWLPWTSLSKYLAKRKRARTYLLYSGIFFGLIFASTPTLKGDIPAKDAIRRCVWPSTLFNVVPYHYWTGWPNLEYRDFWYFWGAWILAISIKEVRWAKAIFESSFCQCQSTRPTHHLSLTLTMNRSRPPLLLPLPNAHQRRSNLLARTPDPLRLRSPGWTRCKLAIRSYSSVRMV